MSVLSVWFSLSSLLFSFLSLSLSLSLTHTHSLCLPHLPLVVWGIQRPIPQSIRGQTPRWRRALGWGRWSIWAWPCCDHGQSRWTTTDQRSQPDHPYPVKKGENKYRKILSQKFIPIQLPMHCRTGISFCPCSKGHHRLYVIINTGQKNCRKEFGPWEQGVKRQKFYSR